MLTHGPYLNSLDEVRMTIFISRSAELFEALNELQTAPETKNYIADVRGQGLMVAVEFTSPGKSENDPGVNASDIPGLASKVQAICLQKGMLILTTSVFEIIRFIPALNITKEELAEGVKIFKEAVLEAVRKQ